MNEQKRVFDVWFVGANTVYKEVPFHVVSGWVSQSRLSAEDMVKPSGTPNWSKVGNVDLFQVYVPPPEPKEKVGDVAEALEPIEMEVAWKRRFDDDDDDVDMIPLIDISLVLLIFFMMTASVSAMSRINVPNVSNGVKADVNPNAVCIDIDLVDQRPLYGVAMGAAAPTGVNANISDVENLMNRLDDFVKDLEHPEVRVAAHAELPYEVVEKVMKELDKRRIDDKIKEYYIEVNEVTR
jgi:biopolymer transport protein ExbD